MDPFAEVGGDSISKQRLPRDGTAIPVSRDQIPRRERGQGNSLFPCYLTMCSTGNLAGSIHTVAERVTRHNTMLEVLTAYAKSISTRHSKIKIKETGTMLLLHQTALRKYMHISCLNESMPSVCTSPSCPQDLTELTVTWQT